MKLLSTSCIEVRNTKQQRNDLRQYRGTIIVFTYLRTENLRDHGSSPLHILIFFLC